MSAEPTSPPAAVFAALGDPTRLALVGRLCDAGPQSIARLTDGAPMTRQAITKHLEVLADAGLVRGSRRGREHIWELAPERLDDARRWIDHASARWDRAIARLRSILRED